MSDYPSEGQWLAIQMGQILGGFRVAYDHAVMCCLRGQSHAHSSQRLKDQDRRTKRRERYEHVS